MVEGIIHTQGQTINIIRFFWEINIIRWKLYYL